MPTLIFMDSPRPEKKSDLEATHLMVEITPPPPMVIVMLTKCH